MTNATTVKMLTSIFSNTSSGMENATVSHFIEEAIRQTERSVPMFKFFKSYGEIHGYVSNAVCIFGVISNIMNVIVLTRKHMITPTNCILCALAIADMLTMLTYLVYATYFYIATEPTHGYGHSQGWMYFILIHNLFILTCHNMAMWLTVSLAIFRYIFVCHHVLAGQLCSLQRAVMTIIIIIVMSVVINVPNYFLYQVVNIQELQNITGYWIQDSDYVQVYKSYKPTTFWVYGVIMKVAPCILLSLLSTLIILMMKQANKRRARLLHQTTRFADSHDHANCEHNRTTWMLITVVLFFVITEFPQGILVMISGLDSIFFEDVYSNLGDIMDLLVLLNSAVNFILYCIMSQQFRDTFRSLFVGKCCYKIRKINGHENGNTTHYTTVRSEVTSV